MLKKDVSPLKYEKERVTKLILSNSVNKNYQQALDFQ